MNFSEFNKLFPNSDYRLIHNLTYIPVPEDYNLPEDKESEEYKTKYARIKKYSEEKAPIGRETYKYEQIAETTRRVGWIVPKEYIAVDVDDKDYAEKLLRMLLTIKGEGNFMYCEGLRGMHFIFKNPNGIKQKVKALCGLGFKVDIRSMHDGYIILPVNDDSRQWGEFCTIDELKAIPYHLIPQPKLKGDWNFIGMAEGDGRNNALYAFTQKLIESGVLSAEEIRQCVYSINHYFFKHKLSESELDKTVLRDCCDEVIQERREKGKQENSQSNRVPKESLDGIAAQVLERYIIKTNESTMYLWNGRYYEFFHDRKLEVILHNEFNSLNTTIARSCKNQVSVESRTQAVSQ